MPTPSNPAKLVTYLLLKQDAKVYLVQYRDSPNPKRSGWWIPAPELQHGEHPEDCATRIVNSLGITDAKPELHGIDSFVTKDWHMLFLYTAETNQQPAISPEYEVGEWFALTNLPEAKDFAHGNWEKDLVLKLVQEIK